MFYFYTHQFECNRAKNFVSTHTDTSNTCNKSNRQEQQKKEERMCDKSASTQAHIEYGLLIKLSYHPSDVGS